MTIWKSDLRKVQTSACPPSRLKAMPMVHHTRRPIRTPRSFRADMRTDLSAVASGTICLRKLRRRSPRRSWMSPQPDRQPPDWLTGRGCRASCGSWEMSGMTGTTFRRAAAADCGRLRPLRGTRRSDRETLLQVPAAGMPQRWRPLPEPLQHACSDILRLSNDSLGQSGRRSLRADLQLVRSRSPGAARALKLEHSYEPPRRSPA
jgi:hypothetical protein